jgi:TPP-dependent pyruvate/acetoin dehydrogenase alpha subunit
MNDQSKLRTNQVSSERALELYRSMYRIRRFDETVLDEFSHGHFYGTTHTYLGQEANAVGVLSNIDKEDIVLSNHRSHGHFLAYGGGMRELFAELMGKPAGVCGGRGGSQHLHWENFYSNGVLGGTAPIAAGMALAERFKDTNSITISFLGDGALGEGILYETFNMASLWSAPILFVLENNRIAQTTPIELNLAGDITARFSAFGILSQELDTSDVLRILNKSHQAISAIRQTRKPQALILNTHRFGPHSKGDDTRPKEELTHLRETRDPLALLAEHLDARKIHAIEEEVNLEVSQAFQEALSEPSPSGIS